jgi:hypothetical protein
MPEKIHRPECLSKYPVFPLRHYDEDKDEEDFFYPEVISGQWMELTHQNDEALTLSLAKELADFIRSFNIESLVLLGDTEQTWISEQGLERKDYKPFSEAVRYFLMRKIDNNFNGGVLVSIGDLETFLIHFYTMVRCDASLPYFHFIDTDQQLLGTIHYSGQIRIDRFSEEASKLFETQILKTGFRNVEKS